MNSRIRNFFRINARDYGVLAAMFWAFIGSILFSLLLSAYTSIIENGISKITVELFFFMLFYCCLFSFLPAGIGGWILGFLLQIFHRKGSLTPRRGKITGVLLAGAAGITISCVGLLFFMWYPHGYYMDVLYEMENGNFLAVILYQMDSFLTLMIRFLPFILFILTTACLGGGLIGRAIARHILTTKPVPVS